MLCDSITVGSTLNYSTAVQDYLPADGWTLVYRLVPRTAGPSPITLTAITDPDDDTQFRVQATAAATAAWTAGVYSWAAWVENVAEKYDLSAGVITLLPDPRTATSLDSRSSARAALDNVQALLAGKATSGVLSYRIGERTLQSYSMGELLQLESKLKQDVLREESACAVAAGQKSRRKIMVRLNRA